MPLAEGLRDRAAEAERIVSDGSLDPTAKVAELRRVRDSLKIGWKGEPDGPVRDQFTSLLGRVDTYIGGLELQRESDALADIMAGAVAREDADIREELLDEGVDPEVLDRAGLISADELEEAHSDGRLSEAIGHAFGLAANFKESLVRRSPHGQFAVKPGTLRGRGGKPLKGGYKPMAPLPQNPRLRDAPGERHSDIEMAERMDKLRPHDPSEAREKLFAKIRALGLQDWPEKGEVAKRLFGDAKDSQDFHTVPVAASPGTEGGEGVRAYTADRKVVHDRIVGESLHGPVSALLGDDHPATKTLAAGGTLSDPEKKAVRDAAEAARQGQKPQALFMAGGPASGKTTALKAAPELEPDAAVLINPDEVKEKLPEYGEMVDGKDRFAAAGVHEESSDVGKRIHAEAVDLGLNVVVDGTGDSKKGKFAGKMKDMDGAGYEVNALYVTIPTEEAVIRATLRARKSGRWVPEPELRSQHKNVSANFEDVAALGFLGSLKVYDNSGSGDPVLIYDGGVVDEERHRIFMDKATEGEKIEEAAEEYGEFTPDPEASGGNVPMEEWIQHPVSDSADYLDGDLPVYAEGGEQDE